ncbi:MAG: hypothetical protein JXB13_15385, partial [Phycisphaerae bacterium]|nr:hypothetical protein [Phycisphaerae bacterium]
MSPRMRGMEQQVQPGRPVDQDHDPQLPRNRQDQVVADGRAASQYRDVKQQVDAVFAPRHGLQKAVSKEAGI